MTTTVYNAKIEEVENKIPDVSYLVKKTDYDAKILDIQKNNVLVLIITNLQKNYLMPRQNKKN